MNIAVLLPCYNEEAAIASVIHAFRQALPEAKIYVYDNNSTDRTTDVAKKAGAYVRFERRKGKGHVVRRMFADIDADIYVMADGDGTYEAARAPAMIDKLVKERLDMVVGARQTVGENAYRFGHTFGNKMLTFCVRTIFGRGFKDMLSGYRVFSKRFVKSFPALSTGFQIETELTVHALTLTLPCEEIEAPYYDRQEGTKSKLRTYRDGIIILSFIVLLFKELRPFVFFGLIALLCALISLVWGIPLIIEFMETGLVPRLPTAILSATSMLIGFVSLVCGIILDSVSRGRIEMKRLTYISMPHSSS